MSVAAPQESSVAESEHRHGNCSKCFDHAEKKNLPQPPIDEKHKQRNQEILERKRKTSNAGRKMSWNESGLESFQMAAKFALERQQQKKTEVSDSHAIDITQYKDADDSAEILLPRHLKKRQSNQSLNLNKTKVENNIEQSLHTSQNEAGDETDGAEDGDGDGDGLEMLRSVEEVRRASLAYRMFGPQRTSPQHDTLQAYFKLRKDSIAKEDRLKKVQTNARIRNIEKETVNSPSMVRKLAGSNSGTILPSLKKLSFQNNSGVKTGPSQISGVHHHKDKTNRERHAKLPKIARRKTKGKDQLTVRDPRFQKLLSCLVPLPDKSGKSPPFTRKRHFTM